MCCVALEISLETKVHLALPVFANTVTRQQLHVFWKNQDELFSSVKVVSAIPSVGTNVCGVEILGVTTRKSKHEPSTFRALSSDQNFGSFRA